MLDIEHVEYIPLIEEEQQTNQSSTKAIVGKLYDALSSFTATMNECSREDEEESALNTLFSDCIDAVERITTTQEKLAKQSPKGSF